VNEDAYTQSGLETIFYYTIPIGFLGYLGYQKSGLNIAPLDQQSSIREVT
jgi:hypothetical protein